ncbi:hypothetical protein ACGFZR_15120 [Streptomyces sp. NPDC048241]|uniref:hypothetical protein n=1 Tax=Streptomyces sp. NPDC048241 TaxID=3365521 RepID=UPI00372304A7
MKIAVTGETEPDQIDVVGGQPATIIEVDTAVNVGSVASVNGQTGVVDLDAGDVGADPAGAAASKLSKTANLADLASTATARTNLGLGGAATLNVGTGSGTVAAGNDSRFTDARTPTTHAATHATAGSDPVTPAQIGALTQALADVRYLLLTGGTLTGPVGGGQGEAFDRWRIDTAGKLAVGPGTAARDTSLERQSGGGWLATGNFTAASGSSFYGAGSSSMPASANGMIGWTGPPGAALNTTNLTAGVVHLAKIWVNRSGTVSGLATRTITTAGAGLSNSYMALYDMTGARLGVTADLSTSWQSATGNRTHPLAASAAVTPGFYYIAWLIGALTTAPGFARSTGTDIHNINLTAGTYCAATYGSGLTAMPTTLTMASMANFTSYLWAGAY